MPLRVFKKSIPVYYVILICAVITVFIYYYLQNKNDALEEYTNSKINITQNQKYKFTKPIMYFDLDHQSQGLVSLKKELEEIIIKDNEEGILSEASIYLRNMETGEWTAINEGLPYHPGSLFKVPMLIYYLKESENNPAILEQTLSMQEDSKGTPVQTYNAQKIQKGKPYTVRELLKYMIVHSDNDATFLLNSYCDLDKFKQMFVDFKLAVPDVHDLKYTISIKDFSLFMRTLYNATYLSAENSETALSLLSQSTFSEGISKKIPNNIAVARKFGEMNDGNMRELHECGIIYCDNKPYMLTIMTKGYDSQNLATVISSISDTIFKFFCV